MYHLEVTLQQDLFGIHCSVFFTERRGKFADRQLVGSVFTLEAQDDVELMLDLACRHLRKVASDLYRDLPRVATGESSPAAKG